MAGPRIALCGVSVEASRSRWESASGLRIGRASSSEVVLNDSSVSREHAELRLTPQGWVPRDLGSSNGTYLNGVPLRGGEHRVRANDLIKLGQVVLRVTAAEAEPPTVTTDRPQVQIRGSGTCFNLKASSRLSWDRAVREAKRPEDDRLWPASRILPLLSAGHHLTQMTSLDDLLRTLLEEVTTVLQAQRGAIVLAHEGTGQLRLRAVVAADMHANPAKHFSQTLADRCYEEGESLLCADVSVEKALAGSLSVTHGGMASIICALLRSPRQRLGVLHLDRGPMQQPFTRDDFDLVDAVACYVSVGIETARMLEQQRELFLRAATTLAQTVEMRDEYTGNHTQRVTAYAVMLAEELGLSPAERQQIAIGAPLHDIGKIAIADALLRKPGKLTPAEQAEMESHVVKGAALLANIPGLTPMVPIVRHHHERWDGRGYPDRLAGEAIPLLARVVAVADAFDAMTTDRPYRRALRLEDALAELVARAGSHFDPRCVEAFVRLRPQVERMLGAAALPQACDGWAVTQLPFASLSLGSPLTDTRPYEAADTPALPSIACPSSAAPDRR
jgi:putative nucleotidyltransferase with HDIG domain